MVKETEPELSRLLREDNYVSLEAILAEMGIKGKSMVESLMVNQSEAGAIDKAKVLVIVPDENRLGRLFIRFADTKYSDASLVESLHKLDSGTVTDFGANECVGFGEDKVGRQKLSPWFEQFSINGFRSGVMIVIFVSQRKERARIQEYFQGY